MGGYHGTFFLPNKRPGVLVNYKLAFIWVVTMVFLFFLPNKRPGVLVKLLEHQVSNSVGHFITLYLTMLDHLYCQVPLMIFFFLHTISDH